MSAGRDPELERAFLEAALREARPNVRAGGRAEPGDFLARVRARLEKGAREYGEAGFLYRPLEDLLGELREEGEDAAGWPVLILQRLLVDDIDPDLARELVAILRSAAALGAQLDAVVDRAFDVLAR